MARKLPLRLKTLARRLFRILGEHTALTQLFAGIASISAWVRTSGPLLPLLILAGANLVLLAVYFFGPARSLGSQRPGLIDHLAEISAKISSQHGYSLVVRVEWLVLDALSGELRLVACLFLPPSAASRSYGTIGNSPANASSAAFHSVVTGACFVTNHAKVHPIVRHFGDVADQQCSPPDHMAVVPVTFAGATSRSHGALAISWAG